MKRLRVVVVIHGYYPRVGGAERQMQYLASCLRDLDMDMHILTRRFDRRLKAFEFIDEIPVYRLPAPGPKPVASIVFTLMSLVYISRLRPNLIHAHEFLSPSTVALLANRWMRKPFVVTLHGGGENGDVQKLVRKTSGKIRLEALKRQAKRFIVVSREIENELLGVGISPDQVIGISNGVNIELFTPLSSNDKTALRSRCKFPTDSLTAIFSGRLISGKRVNSLLEIWPNVRAVHPSAILLIAGTGPEQETLQKKRVDGVCFLGNVDNIVPYLQMSDLFVLPSIAEGLSVAMLEAMACGLPALVTDVGGARQVIKDRESGWLIKPDDLGDLENSIKALFADAGIRSSLGRLGRKRVEELFSIHTAAEKLHGLYLEVAGDIR